MTTFASPHLQQMIDRRRVRQQRRIGAIDRAIAERRESAAEIGGLTLPRSGMMMDYFRSQEAAEHMLLQLLARDMEGPPEPLRTLTGAIVPTDRSVLGTAAASLGRGVIAGTGEAGSETVAIVGTVLESIGIPGGRALREQAEHNADFYRFLQDVALLTPSLEDRELDTWEPGNPMWWVSNGPQALGTWAPALFGGGAMGLLGRGTAAARTAAAVRVGSYIVMAQEGGLKRAEMMEALQAEGYSEEDARLIATFGAIPFGIAAGLTERIPLATFFRRAPKGMKSKALRLLRLSGEEGGQEAIQEFLGIVTEWSAGLDVGDVGARVGAATSLGAVMGPIAGGVVMAGRAARAGGPQPITLEQHEAAQEAMRALLGKEPGALPRTEGGVLTVEDIRNLSPIEQRGLLLYLRDAVRENAEPTTGQPLTPELRRKAFALLRTLEQELPHAALERAISQSRRPQHRAAREGGPAPRTSLGDRAAERGRAALEIGRVTVTSGGRLAAKLEEIEKAAAERIVTRQRPAAAEAAARQGRPGARRAPGAPPVRGPQRVGAITQARRSGFRGGSAPIFLDLYDSAAIVSARALRLGITTPKEIRSLVAAYIDEINRKDLRAHKADIERRVRRILISATRKETAGGFRGEVVTDPDEIESGFELALTELRAEAVARSQGRRPTPRAQIRAALTGQPVAGEPRTIKQSEALRASLTRQEQTTREAFRAGVRLVTARIPIIKAQLREAARKAVVNIKEVKANIRKLVHANIPKAKQGRFLGDVEKATTPAAFDRALDKVLLVGMQTEFEEAVTDYKRTRKSAGTWKLSEEERQRVKNIKDVADGVAFSTGQRRRSYGTAGQYGQAAGDLRRLRNDMLEVRAESLAARNEIGLEKRQNKEAHKKELLANIAKARNPMKRRVTVKRKVKERGKKTRTEIVEDFEAGIWQRIARNLQDVDTLTSKVERKWQDDDPGVLHDLLDTAPKAKEEDYNRGVHLEWARADQIVRGFGFENLPDAMAKATGSLGEAMVERMDITIGGETVSVMLDEAMHIAAFSEADITAFELGAPLQLDTARHTRRWNVTRDEITNIQQQVRDRFGLEDDQADLGRVLKDAIAENIRPDLMATHRRLKGWEPPWEPDYLPRSRNIDMAGEVGLPEIGRGMTQKYLENADFFEEREFGSKAPILVKGLLRTYLEHVDYALKVIHLSEGIRDASSVLLDPDIVESITQRWGVTMNDYLRQHLIEASLVNVDSVAGPDRALRILNNNIFGTFLTLNEATYLRQLGSLYSLWSVMDTSDFLAGLRALQPGTLREMQKESGYLWARTQGNSYSRFSPVRGSGIEGLDAVTFIQSLEGAKRSILSGLSAAVALEGKEVGAQARGLAISYDKFARSIKFLDWFDAVNSRVAWEGYKASWIRQGRKGTEAEMFDWVARKTARAIRSTNNSSSPLDASTLAVRTRNSPIRFFLMFTTQANKQYNMVLKGIHQGPKQGAKAATGALMNVLWSGASTGLIAWWWRWLGATVFLEGDEEEARKAEILADSLDRALWRAARDLAGTVYGGDRLLEAVEAARKPFKRERLGQAPITESISAMGDSLSDLAKLIEELPDDQADIFSMRTAEILADFGEASSPLWGNPFLMPYYRARAFFGEIPDEKGELQPTRR